MGSLSHFEASKGCESLLLYTGRDTSISVFNEMLNSGEYGKKASEYIRLMTKHTNGLTDLQASRLLNYDASTVSGLRNNITKKYGSHVFVKTGVRDNSGEFRKRGSVWIINPYLETKK